MIRYFRLSMAVIAVLAVLAIRGFGCSCAGQPYRPGVTLDQIRKEKREYFLKEYAGAAFIGKIVKRERVKVDWIARTETGEPASIEWYRYTLRVKEYWLGVNSRTVYVYGEPEKIFFGKSAYSASSCGFKLHEGKTYFFTPRLEQNKLAIGLCDFAGGGSDPSEYPATEFRKIMGEPRTLK